MLPLRVAEGRLARLRVPRGQPDDVRYMSRYFLRPHEQSLIHGVELVAQAFGVEKSEVARAAESKAHESEFYTVAMIDDVLATVSESTALHERLRAGFIRMMAFDALIGANDRHAENWGTVEDVRSSRLIGFAPIYDTARGLLLRISDTALASWYASDPAKEIARYANRSVSLIGTGAHARPNHFQVFEQMVGDPRFRGIASHLIHAFSLHSVDQILRNEFSSLVSRIRLRAIRDLLRYRHARLSEICKTSRPAVS